MTKETLNKTLSKARENKNDDFYTQLTDIEKELKHYKTHFKDKVVFCNETIPRVSNFSIIFHTTLKIRNKKLITTCYKNREMDLFSKNEAEQAIYLEYNGDKAVIMFLILKKLGLNT